MLLPSSYGLTVLDVDMSPQKGDKKEVVKKGEVRTLQKCPMTHTTVICMDATIVSYTLVSLITRTSYTDKPQELVEGI